MIGEGQPHETSMSVAMAALAKLDAGTDIALKVNASCPSACDLQGRIVIKVHSGKIVSFIL
jgi:hypothetical protein